MKYYLGIDLGGTNIAVGIVDENYVIVDKTSAPTPKGLDYKQLCDVIIEVCNNLLSKNNLDITQIEFGGIGAPGAVITDKGILTFACNLNLKDAPIGVYLTENLKTKIYVCNDADAAAFGEYLAGAAKNSKIAVTITLGTGIGTGVIIDHKIIPGEGGHTVIDSSGEKCACGRNGCFESFASATALIRQTKQAMQQDTTSLLWQVAPTLEQVNGKTVFDAAELNDKAAQAVIDQYIQYVATGVLNMVNTFLADTICIGGGISAQNEKLILPVEKLVNEQQFLINGTDYTKVCACLLGNDAGIIGAAIFGKYL